MLTVGALGVAALVGAVVVLVKDLPAAAVVCVVLGALALAAAVATHRLLGRSLYAAFRRDGWVAVQAPTGFFLVVNDSTSLMKYGPVDSGESGRLMLVSAKDVQPADFVRALSAVRRHVADLPDLQRDRLGESIRQAGLNKAHLADRFFPEAPGCVIGTSAGSGDLVLVIPRKSTFRLLPVRKL
jgi:hypothetical protein